MVHDEASGLVGMTTEPHRGGQINEGGALPAELVNDALVVQDQGYHGMARCLCCLDCVHLGTT